MERILDQYFLYGANITIKDVNGIGLYIIKDPVLDFKDKKLAEKYIRDIHEKGIGYNYTKIIEYLSDFHLDQSKLEKIAFYVFKKLTYDDLTVPYFDTKIERIECYSLNKPVSVIHSSYKKYGRLYTNIIFNSTEEIRFLLTKFGKDTSSKKIMSIGEFYTYENNKILYYFDNNLINFEIIKSYEEQPIITNVLRNNNIDCNTLSYLWETLEYKPFYIIISNKNKAYYLFNSLLYLLPQYIKIATIERYPLFNFKDRTWLTFHISAQYKSKLISSVSKYEPDFVLLDLDLDYIESLLKYFPTQSGLLMFTNLDSISNIMNLISNYLSRNLEKIFVNKLDGIIVFNDKLRIFEKYKLGNKVRFKEIKIPENLNELGITPQIRNICRRSRNSYNDIIKNITIKSEVLRKIENNNIIDNSQIQEILLQYQQ